MDINEEILSSNFSWHYFCFSLTCSFLVLLHSILPFRISYFKRLCSIQLKQQKDPVFLAFQMNCLFLTGVNQQLPDQGKHLDIPLLALRPVWTHQLSYIQNLYGRYPFKRGSLIIFALLNANSFCLTRYTLFHYRKLKTASIFLNLACILKTI